MKAQNQYDGPFVFVGPVWCICSEPYTNNGWLEGKPK